MIGSYILIIGAMKSGTTTLFAQHPQIAPAPVKTMVSMGAFLGVDDVSFAAEVHGRFKLTAEERGALIERYREQAESLRRDYDLATNWDRK